LAVASYGLIGTAVIAAAGYVAWRNGIDGTALAAWVQAIGSLAAIAIAIWVPAWQRHQEREATRRDTLLRLFLIARESVQIFANVGGQLDDGTFQPARFDSERLSMVRSNLAALDGAMLSSRMVVAAFTLQDVLGELFEWHRHLAAQPDPFLQVERPAITEMMLKAMRLSRLAREELANHGIPEPDWRSADE